MGWFFYTLNKNHKVLYAPSDFKKDESFVNLIKPTSILEKAEKLRDQSNEIDEVNKEHQILKVDNSMSTQSTENAVSVLDRNLNRNTRANYALAEELGLLKINQELGGELIRDMKYFSKQGRKIYLDGIIQNRGKITAIEIKYIPNAQLDAAGFILTYEPIHNLIQSLEEVNDPNLALILALVSDVAIKNPNNILDSLHHFTVNTQLPVEIKIFSIEELENEFNL